eukprot:1175737-Prorocentrum_minimum.AAC.2
MQFRLWAFRNRTNDSRLSNSHAESGGSLVLRGGGGDSGAPDDHARRLHPRHPHRYRAPGGHPSLAPAVIIVRYNMFNRS